MLRRKKKKQHQRVEEESRFLSALWFLEAGSLQLRKPGARSLVKYLCTYVSSCSSILPPLQHTRLGSVSESLASCKQWLANSSASPHSLCHCLLTGPARAERLRVTTFHLLYYNTVQEDVPQTPVCRWWIHSLVLPRCDDCHPFLATMSNTI